MDDAITTACQRLSVTSNRLDYIVVQREKSGFLGIGAKPAIIKARVKDAADATQAILDDVIDKAEKKIQKELNGKSPEKKEIKDSAPAAKEETKKDAEKTEKKELKEKDKEGKKNNKKNKKKSSAPKKAEAEAPAAAASAAPVEEKAAPAPKKKAVIPQLTDEKIAEIKKAAHDFLVGVFKTMDMNVEISEEYQKETGILTVNMEGDDMILTVNMEGDDMGVLIGKRGQTLDSLQYLVSLVVNKDVDGYIHVKADTENYRERRKKTLENLAKNIAFKVKRTRQPVALEPMNPYERRIIHSALQDEKFITTYSEGEEPYRKVVVALKKDENGEDLLKEERFEKGGRGRNGRGRNGRGRKGRDYRGSKDNRRGSDRSAENNSKPESEE